MRNFFKNFSGKKSFFIFRPRHAALSFCFVLILILLPHPVSAQSEPVLLGRDDARWISNMIFKNECSLRAACLTSWNEGEDFPSLGIGHFIWYPQNRRGPFRESFPELIAYLKTAGRAVPAWLEEMVRSGMPWKDRTAFLADQNGEAMIGLRQFLKDTMDDQALFMMRRFQSSMNQMAQAVSSDRRAVFIEKVFELTRTRNGIYAMIDYTNFKGDGLSEAERYHTHGWGLFQVLQEMRWPAGTAGVEAEFVDAARKVLRRRVDNAPSERLEERWIKGWENRVATYSSSADSFQLLPVDHPAQVKLEKTESVEVFNFAEIAV